MPKATFFNLPEEKRKKIIDVLITEYTTKPYNEVTTRVLTKKAEIPMGSFYQYFENKDESYIYIYTTIQEKVYKNLPLDTPLIFLSKPEHLNCLEPEEIEFLKTIHNVPENVMMDINFKYNSLAKDVFKRFIIKMIEEKKISSEVDADSAAYILASIGYNGSMYVRNNDITIEQYEELLQQFLQEFFYKKVK